MNIRVEEIRKLERGSIRGFATVSIGGIRISHIKIVYSEGKEIFIGMPQRSYQMTNGERRYSNIVDLPDDLKREVEKAILRFWNLQRYAWPNADQGTQAA
jgi:SpoVG